MIIDRKGLIFFGLVLAFIMGFFILLGGVSFSQHQQSYVFGATARATVASDQEMNLPMPKPSNITTKRNQIRLDLEQVTVHKYYIVYSVIYGNQSHTAYHLYLTDLNRKTLDPEKVGDIWIETAKGERVEQVAEPTIYDYPQDQPLKWKIGIIAKFPYQISREQHKIFFRYDGQIFELKEIAY